MFQVGLSSPFKINQTQSKESINQPAKNKTIKINNVVKSNIQEIGFKTKVDIKDLETKKFESKSDLQSIKTAISTAKEKTINNSRAFKGLIGPKTKLGLQDLERKKFMSNADLQSIKTAISRAKEITINSASAFKVLITTSFDSFRNLLTYAGKDTQYLAKYFVKLITIYLDENGSNLRKLLLNKKIIESKSSANVGYKDLTQLGYLCSNTLLEVLKSYENQTKEVESINTKSVLKLEKAIKKKYQTLLPSNAKFKLYVDNMNKKVREIAHSLIVKYKEMTKNCLGKLNKMAIESGISIKNLANVSGKLLIATANKHFNKIHKLNARIRDIPRNIKITNGRFYKDLDKEITERSKLFEVML